MNRYCVALSTASSREEADRLARALLERGAAACVTIIADALSLYKWQGQLCEEREWLLIIKTRADCQPAIEDVFRQLHSYQVPELVLLPIEGGKTEYLSWLEANLADPA